MLVRWHLQFADLSAGNIVDFEQTFLKMPKFQAALPAAFHTTNGCVLEGTPEGEIGMCLTKGHMLHVRERCEDTGVIAKHDSFAMAAIMDGHGGADCAKFVASELCAFAIGAKEGDRSLGTLP